MREKGIYAVYPNPWRKDYYKSIYDMTEATKYNRSQICAAMFAEPHEDKTINGEVIIMRACFAGKELLAAQMPFVNSSISLVKDGKTFFTGTYKEAAKWLMKTGASSSKSESFVEKKIRKGGKHYGFNIKC